MKHFNFLLKKSKKGITVMFFLILSTFTFGQTSHYLGTEKNISNDFLIKQAKKTDFGEMVAAQIFKDEKNSYFAVDLKKVASKYVRIRILELTYDDKVLVNINGSLNDGYLLFLVNNTLNQSQEKVISLIEKLKTKATVEESKMSSEEINLWLLQNDKYSKKY